MRKQVVVNRPFKRTDDQRTAKLIEDGRRLSKNWNFEKLEDRQMMAVDFNDPYFAFQWPLLNTGGVDIGDQQIQGIRGVAGEDINVVPAWEMGYTGEGVVVAIVSTGIQKNHPDLEANISGTLAYDAVNRLDLSDNSLTGEALTSQPGDAVGTALAGIVGAVANNGEGIVGVAYESELVPVTLVSSATDLNSDIIDPTVIEDLFLWANQDIDIYLHAWGPDDSVNTLISATEAQLAALRDSATVGRDGLGNIHIFSAGDGAGESVGAFTGTGSLVSNDFAGYNGYVNSRFTIGVTAIDHDGEAANFDGTLTRYAEASAAVLVAAPSGSTSLNGIIDEPTVGTGVWTTDFAPNESDPNALLQEGYNAPTDENGQESDDLLIDPFTGLTITDRFEDTAYTSRYSGTDAAAAHVAGVVALMLEADREANNGIETLSYRDVQEILVRSARQAAPSEALQDGADKGVDFEHPETWITNRNETFHASDQFDPLIPIGLELYSPIIDAGEGENQGTEFSNVSLWTNGAGYTVSQGRTKQGSEVGYGHGVVDAELAVKLASVWNATGQTLAAEQTWTTEAQPVGIGIPAVSIGSMEIQYLVVPGTLGERPDIITYYNEYGTDDPFADYTGPFPTGGPLEISVPEDNSMVVEWVEVGLQLSSGDIDELRITLVSPSGVHSELNHYFDDDTIPSSNQYGLDPINLGGEIDDLFGAPGGTGDADGGGLFFTFTTNRHWGELTDPQVMVDPATGEPYLAVVDEDGNQEPLTAGWQLLFENYGDEPITLQAYEVAFHGTPLAEDTVRIQGAIGVDENQDGAFNYERYIQTYEDLDPELSLANDEADFYRLGEVEREYDETQEQFAENVTVELWARTLDQVNAGDQQGTLVDMFITGDDGNYYFDVAPPVSTEVDDDFDIEIVFDDNVTESVRAAFDNAVDIWESVIVGDVADVLTDGGVIIDDIVIYASAPLLDGPGGLLGQAGPTTLRDDGSFLPAAGTMQFDSADLEELELAGELEFLLLHEMAHVLGVGTIWEDLGLLSQAGTTDPRFIGPEATAAFNELFGVDELGVPVEGDPNTGGGTRDSHWSELVFDNELMTGFLNPGEDNPLSIITVASMADLGYEVDMSAAQPYDVPPGGFPPPGFPPPDPLAPLTAAAVTTSNATSGMVSTGAVMMGYEGEVEMVSVAPLSGGGSEAGPDDIVEYIVRVVDNEGRGEALVDTDAPDGFLEKYRAEWTLTEDYFRVWEHEGRAPEYERDATSGAIIPDPFNPAVPATLLGDGTFNPATDYDILVDDNGVPVPHQLLGVDFGTTAVGEIFSGVSGINFLLNPLAEESDPTITEVTVGGQVFHDKDNNGEFDGEDVGLGNVFVYLDENYNGSFDPGEQSMLTNPGVDEDGNLAPELQGTYSFSFFGDADGDGQIDEDLVDTAVFQIGVDEPFGFEHGTPLSGVIAVLVSPGDDDVTDTDFALLDFGTLSPPDPDDPDDPDDPVDPVDPPPTDAPGRVGGIVYEDLNGDAVRDSNEFGVSGVIVYLDANNNSVRDNDEQFTVTNSNGAYDLSDIEAGNITVRIETELPFEQTAPTGTGSIFIDLDPGESAQNQLFGVRNLATRDFGDLANFPTFEADGGAWHEIKAGLFLGAKVDGEIDGQPNAFGTGDDINGTPGQSNDDDGVTLIDEDGDGIIEPGETINFEFLVTGAGQSINAWIDFNGDGDWDDEGEHVFIDADVIDGVNLTGDGNAALPELIAPLDTATDKPIAARFRLGGAGLGYSGPADSGEVEDYLYNIEFIDPSLLIPGDYDLNGTVNSDDYAVWSTEFGTMMGSMADGNGDGVVDLADYTIWRNNLGETTPITEPLGLLVGGGSESILAAAVVAEGDDTPDRFAAFAERMGGRRGGFVRPEGGFDPENFDPSMFEGMKGDFDPSQFDGERPELGDFAPSMFAGMKGDFDPSMFAGMKGDFDPSKFDGERPGAGNFDPSMFDSRSFETRLGTFDLDSFLASEGMRRGRRVLGGEEHTVIETVGATDIDGARALLELIGLRPGRPMGPALELPLGDGAKPEAFDPADLDLAFADKVDGPLFGARGPRAEFEIDSDEGEIDSEALEVALEDDLL